ncbi:MAG TPA: immunoglobulin domain-containing protein, partial [Verrucomicrobiae bacterium]|nr:immunoglobulin domain-containing protein [Verrucomicrobiae bacterium]
MKRKLFLSSAMVSVMLASGASAQVVNFHDDNNAFPLDVDTAPYNELFAGQGAYADPGNDIWNGFGQSSVYGTFWFYSGGPGSGTTWPQQFGNPGNPYSAYLGYSGWVSSIGDSLYNFDTGSTNTISGNSDSSGLWNPVTLSVVDYSFDNGFATGIPNGSPAFLLSNAALSNGLSTGAVFKLQHVPPGTYGLYLYGANFDNNGGTLFSVSNGTAHLGIAATLNNGIGSPANAFVEGQNFVIFQNVTPDTNGNITITASPNPQAGVGNANVSGQTAVNGFQLIFNPPPTAVAITAAQNVYLGGTASFSFSPAFLGTNTPSYQWQFISGGVTNNLSDSNNVSGSATTHLTLANVAATNAGLYQCVIATASATNTSPAAPLTILTSTLANILQPGDILTDFGGNTNPPYNSIPPPFNMSVTSVEDNTLNQYENFGANGSVAPFVGPVGFVVTPKAGAYPVSAMRLFTASSHPEDDPYDYLLEGSFDGTNFTAISGGLLNLPAQRNAAGGAIDVGNQVLEEFDFANTNAYSTYRLTFTNVNNDAIASNGVQIAEIQLLGASVGAPPALAISNSAPGTVVVSWPTSASSLFVLQQ